MKGTPAGFFLLRFVLPVLCLLFPMQANGSTGADIVRATLDNGLRVIIVRNALAPVVTTEINYLAGSNEAPAGFPGMAHAQEHMMFRGSPGLSADQLSTIIASLGGEFNADTQQTVTQYFFTLPADDIDIALNVEAVRMKGILDEEKLWEKERGAIEQEVAQDLSSPEYVFYSELLKKMFEGTPYEHDALGTRESFNKTTGSMLRKFFETWYVPNNAVLVIVGDIDSDKTLDKVRELFGSVPSRSIPVRPKVELRPLKPAEISLETDLSVGLAIVAYRLPGFDSPDYAAGQILADVLDSHRGDLYGLVPAGKALSFDFSGEVLPQAGFAYATASFPKGAEGSKLIGEMKEIIEGYLRKGFPPDLVEAAKRREVASAEFQKNSVSGLAELWSQTVAVEGRNSPEDDIEAFKRVTVGDVNRVAGEYLMNDRAITGLLTPRSSGMAVKSKGFGGKESFTPERTGKVELPPWAQQVEKLPEVPASTVNPTVMVLPNGLRLIVQTERISPTVSIRGQVKNNPFLETPKGREGVDSILDNLFSYGTKEMDRVAFQKALDDIAADLSAGTDFSLDVLSDHLDRGVQLLSQNILEPRLPEDAFKTVREETAGELAGRLQSPSYLASRAIRKALYPADDPSLRQATPETVKNLGLDDVKEYYRKVFRPDMTTIVMVGAVTPEKARSVVEKYFGGWEATGPRPETDLPPVPSNRAATAEVPDESRVQDEVTFAETLGITRSSPDYYTLKVGQHILSGAFYATRLYRDLREKAGLVYTVEAELEAKKTRSIFAVVYGCDPENVSRAAAVVRHDLEEMRKEVVSSRELQQAKTLLLRRIPLAESSFDDIAGQLLGFALEDLPLDEPVRAGKRYRAVTAEEIRGAFRQWIRPGDFVQISLGPPPK